jgi:peptidylprolyl isomerase
LRKEEVISMSNQKPPTKRMTRAEVRAAKARQKETIRIIGIVVIAVAIVGIVWLIASSQKKPAQTSASQTNPAQNGGATPAPVGTKQFSSAPPMLIDKSKQYTATVKMANGGEFTIQLYPDKAPITVNSFVFLARQGFFDGVTFHRVLKDFMAQGGDPTGTGGGGPGYQFVNEDSNLKFDKAGVVAMANAGRDTNGSQFFITFGPTPSLNGGYTIFGQVVSGMDVVNAIKLRDPDTNPTFTGDAIQSVTITEK